MATISEVAKTAGVSVATVSRVVNGSHNVKPETAKQVWEAIRQLKYVPNMSARNLRLNESRVVLVLARNFTNPFYAKVLAGISDVTNEAGYRVLMCKNDGDVEQTLQYFKMLDYHQADGAIFLNCTRENVWLSSYIGKYPIVQCCEYATEFDAPKVYIDDFRNEYEATNYLISLGHRNIEFMSADNQHISTINRYAGYCRAMEEAGLDIRVIKADGNYTFDSGFRALAELLEKHSNDRPTALLCVSDELARGAILAASELGLDVPGDLSVIGCDDTDYTTMWHPFLTTIHIPCYELGAESARLLLEYIRIIPEKGDDVLMPTQLVIRESCAPPREQFKPLKNVV